MVAQRLVADALHALQARTLLSVEALEQAGFHAAFDVEAYEPVGCARCSGTGYKGRVGVYEVMEMTEEIRALTVERASADEIRKVAIAAGHAPAAAGRAREGQERRHVDRRGCAGHVIARCCR